MPAPLPRRLPLDAAVGAVRVAAVLALVVGATPAIGLSLLLPRRADGTRAVHAVGRAVCRAFLWTCGVRRVVDGADALAGHRGLVFFNHPSFIDPLVVMAALPVRFVGAAGVQRIPFVGAMARAAGTLFVDRGDAESRSATRDGIARALAAETAPVALAPEGGIWKEAGVGPLRHGAFEVAAAAGAPVLLVGLRNSDRRRLEWRDGEWLLAPLWRLCARVEPVVARLSAAGVLDPSAAPPDALAREARRRLGAAVGPSSVADGAERARVARRRPIGLADGRAG